MDFCTFTERSTVFLSDASDGALVCWGCAVVGGMPCPLPGGIPHALEHLMEHRAIPGQIVDMDCEERLRSEWERRGGDSVKLDEAVAAYINDPHPPNVAGTTHVHRCVHCGSDAVCEDGCSLACSESPPRGSERDCGVCAHA